MKCSQVPCFLKGKLSNWVGPSQKKIQFGTISKYKFICKGEEFPLGPTI
jgi:hypothetical protein